MQRTLYGAATASSFCFPTALESMIARPFILSPPGNSSTSRMSSTVGRCQFVGSAPERLWLRTRVLTAVRLAAAATTIGRLTASVRSPSGLIAFTPPRQSLKKMIRMRMICLTFHGCHPPK